MLAAGSASSSPEPADSLQTRPPMQSERLSKMIPAIENVQIRSMACRIRASILLIAALSLGSCLLLPIPTGEDLVLAGKPVTEEQLAFIILESTTQQEVTEHLGSPKVIWEDAHVFVYDWEMRQGILIWAFAGAYTGTGGVENISKHYVLLIQFDEQDRVQRYEAAVRPVTQPFSDFLEYWLKSPARMPPHESTGKRMKRNDLSEE